MKYSRTLVAGLSVSLLLAGCVATSHLGHVTMKVSDKDAHISMPDRQLRVGDSVTLLTNTCSKTGIHINSKSSNFPASNCYLSKLGDARVTQTLNERYYVIEVKPGTQFREGDLVTVKE